MSNIDQQTQADRIDQTILNDPTPVETVTADWKDMVVEIAHSVARQTDRNITWPLLATIGILGTLFITAYDHNTPGSEINQNADILDTTSFVYKTGLPPKVLEKKILEFVEKYQSVGDLKQFVVEKSDRFSLISPSFSFEQGHEPQIELRGTTFKITDTSLLFYPEIDEVTGETNIRTVLGASTLLEVNGNRWINFHPAINHSVLSPEENSSVRALVEGLPVMPSGILFQGIDGYTGTVSIGSYPDEPDRLSLSYSRLITLDPLREERATYAKSAIDPTFREH